ncbi:hypothetical protein RRG08_036279 [Elysia crispata]|uniref:Uncharacterized protein n=1 Tax=Elysia crispata TaxID=231223 RepID=A0AAE0ZT63_9GAST|nr:hypothetical protein RRG08_036279 [Elysia crispata]
MDDEGLGIWASLPGWRSGWNQEEILLDKTAVKKWRDMENAQAAPASSSTRDGEMEREVEKWRDGAEVAGDDDNDKLSGEDLL